jgi:hypothetical protein
MKVFAESQDFCIGSRRWYARACVIAKSLPLSMRMAPARLKKECGIQEVIQSLLAARRYGFDVERAILSHRVASAFC